MQQIAVWLEKLGSLSTLSGVYLELGGDVLERVKTAAVQEMVAGLGRTFLGMLPIVLEAHSDAQVESPPSVERI